MLLSLRDAEFGAIGRKTLLGLFDLSLFNRRIYEPVPYTSGNVEGLVGGKSTGTPEKYVTND
jgi:hypothetical protein